MSTAGPDDFFRPPNDNAYEADELRTGPLLDYMAGRSRRDPEVLHLLIYDCGNQRCE